MTTRYPYSKTFASVLCLAFLAGISAFGAEAGPESGEPGAAAAPPALVNVAPMETGSLAPDAEFIGTVYFKEVSTVAAETAGKVEALNFDTGLRLKKGDILIHLDSQILETSILALEASLQGAQVDLEQARVNLVREEKLFKDDAGAERDYDDARFAASSLESRVASLKAGLEGARIELRKRDIPAPFDGVVLQKMTEVGQWITAGGPVAVIANESTMDVIADVPASILPYVKTGMAVPVSVGGDLREGKVFAVIPRGDIATRSFPVKIRLENQSGLFEGMEARARLPVDAERQCLIAPRDAVINFMGQDAIFTVSPDSTAVPRPVKIIGFQGLHAGLEADGLKEGAQVVVKGQERLRPGQNVSVAPAFGAQTPAAGAK